MKTIGAAEFRTNCARILDELGPEGIAITKRGKPVAEVRPLPRNHAHLIGILGDIDIRTDPNDDLISTVRGYRMTGATSTCRHCQRQTRRQTPQTARKEIES